MLRNNYFGETKTHYKLYKCGKNWAVMGISLFSLGLGMLVTGRPVSADVTTTSTSSSAVKTETTSASSSSATKADSTNASSSSATKADSTSASGSSAVKAETTSASSSSATKANVTSASSSSAAKVKTTSAKTRQTVTKISYNTLLQQLHTSKTLATDKEVLTHVTKDNFTDYFSLNGSATYDQNKGIVTITPDENNKVGNFSLKSKIDMNTSFTLTGQINLGNRTSSQGGADGIGFAFHTGNTTDIGSAGGNLGIGGLQNAIGFKLDTYHNGYRTPQANKDGAQVASTDSDGYGWDTDPDGTQFPQFGAFVNTSQKLVQAQDGNSYSRWWATTDMSSVQKLNSGDLDGQFHDFVVSYDGSSRKLTIKYTETGGNVLTWSTSIPDANQAMAMVVSASTGFSKNLQQFKISSFDFKQAATVNVKYVDQKGNQLAQGTVSYPSGAYVNGTYDTTSLNIPNYTFIKMSDSDITGGTSLPASGTLENPGDNGTVIYVYAPAYSTTMKTVNETINYVNQNGETVSASYTATPINFLTVTNPVDGSSVTYYSIDNTDSTLDKETGFPTNSKWKQGSSTDFQKVVNPEVKGYTVTSNNAPNSDLTSVATQTVYNNSSDLNFTVVYTKDAPTVTTETKTVNETIHYVYKDGTTAHDDYVATPIEFTRQVSTDAVTGEKTYGPWSADQNFAAVTSPAIKGYTPDQAEIGSQTVSGDSSDLEFTVVYTKDAPTKPVDPSQPTTPTKPVDPSQPTTPTKPVDPSQPTMPTKPVQAGQAAATNFVDQRLPQTDENNSQSQTMSFIGILLAMFGSLLGFLGIKKRRND